MQNFSSHILKPIALDLEPEHLALVQDILHTHIPSYTVWAFGSRVTGKPKPMSDLDLAVVGDAPLSLQTLGSLQEAFEESALPIKVDVVDFFAAHSSFQKIIEDGKVVIQG